MLLSLVLLSLALAFILALKLYAWGLQCIGSLRPTVRHYERPSQVGPVGLRADNGQRFVGANGHKRRTLLKYIRGAATLVLHALRVALDSIVNPFLHAEP